VEKQRVIAAVFPVAKQRLAGPFAFRQERACGKRGCCDLPTFPERMHCKSWACLMSKSIHPVIFYTRSVEVTVDFLRPIFVLLLLACATFTCHVLGLPALAVFLLLFLH
jgi:hypothetical protein